MRRQGRGGMFLVYFFGVQTFAWIDKRCVQLWNADVDVPGDKRPLLQKVALEEAYAWQKEVFTKPPTRRRNPEPVVKPRHDAKQLDTIRMEKKNFLHELKLMYKAQTKELKRARRIARAISRGYPPPEHSDNSSDASSSSSSDSGSEHNDDPLNKSFNSTDDRTEDSSNHDDWNSSSSIQSKLRQKAKPTSSSSNPKKLTSSTSNHVDSPKSSVKSKSQKETTNSSNQPDSSASRSRWPIRSKLGSTSSVNSSTNQDDESGNEESDESEEDSSSSNDESDEEEATQGPNEGKSKSTGDRVVSSAHSTSSSIPMVVDDFTEIDLSSAIQRGKFILRARKNETAPPKKRKYTRRLPPSSSKQHRRSRHDDDSDDDEQDEEEELNSKRGRKKSSSDRRHRNDDNDDSDGDSDQDDDGSEGESRTSKSKNLCKSSSSVTKGSLSMNQQHSKHSSENKNRMSGSGKNKGNNSSSGTASNSMQVDDSDVNAKNALAASLFAHNEGLLSTIASRRALRKSGHLGGHSSPPEELLSLPPPTRMRNKTSPSPNNQDTAKSSSLVGNTGITSDPPTSSSVNHLKSSTYVHASSSPSNNNGDLDDEMLISAHSPSNDPSPSSGGLSNSKKIGRGKYVRKGKRDQPIPSSDASPADAICSSCALARPSFTRQPLGLFLFYLVEDHASSQRLGLPRYSCTAPGCSQKFFTEFELKSHSSSHYDRLAGLYSAPPTKKPKLSEDDEDQDNRMDESEQVEEFDDSEAPKSKKSSSSRKKTVANKKMKKVEDAEEEENRMEVDNQTTVNQTAVTPTTGLYCDFPGCYEDEPYENRESLKQHVEKVHCGGLDQQVCSRCGTRSFFTNTVSQPPQRVGRYAARNTTSAATTCTHGRGRKIPFDPRQGLSAPNMISLPLLNLSYQPPAVPVLVASPPPMSTGSGELSQATSMAAPTNVSPTRTHTHHAPKIPSPTADHHFKSGVVSPTHSKHSASSLLNTSPPSAAPPQPLGSSMDDNEDGRPSKRSSTRVRRTSAAGLLMQQSAGSSQYIYSPPNSRPTNAAPVPAPPSAMVSKPSPSTFIAPTPKFPSPPSAVPQKKTTTISSIPSSSSPTLLSQKIPKKPVATPSTTKTPPPISSPPAIPPTTVPPAAAADKPAGAGADMGAFLDFINICATLDTE